MQWMKDGQCCGYHFARAKPLQLHEVIHGCKPRGEAGEQLGYQGISTISGIFLDLKWMKKLNSFQFRQEFS